MADLKTVGHYIIKDGYLLVTIAVPVRNWCEHAAPHTVGMGGKMSNEAALSTSLSLHLESACAQIADNLMAVLKQEDAF